MPVGEGGTAGGLLKYPLTLGGLLGVCELALTGSTSRLRGDGGDDELAEPGRLSCSMRKYSGLTKPAAGDETELP